jgi:hypothetical protein
VQTKAVTPQPYSGKRLATAGFILGIFGIILNIAGMVPAILAIVFGIITLTRKTPYVIRAVMSIILGCIGVVVSIIAGIFILGSIIGMVQQHTATNAPFLSTPITGAQQQVDEKKNFTINETAKVGPYNYKVLRVVPDYTLAPSQTSTPLPYPTEFYHRIDPSTGQYGTIIKPGDAEFVFVNVDISRNDSPDLNDSSVMQLNNVGPMVHPATATGQVEYIFRIRKATQLTLTIQNTITTASLFLVGSEGAPQVTLTYTMALN